MQAGGQAASCDGATYTARTRRCPTMRPHTHTEGWGAGEREGETHYTTTLLGVHDPPTSPPRLRVTARLPTSQEQRVRSACRARVHTAESVVVCSVECKCSAQAHTHAPSPCVWNASATHPQRTGTHPLPIHSHMHASRPTAASPPWLPLVHNHPHRISRESDRAGASLPYPFPQHTHTHSRARVRERERGKATVRRAQSWLSSVQHRSSGPITALLLAPSPPYFSPSSSFAHPVPTP